MYIHTGQEVLQNLDFARKKTVPSFMQEELEMAVVSKHVSHAAKNNLADIQDNNRWTEQKGFCEISRSQGLEI